jgi:hypothetical protein
VVNVAFFFRDRRGRATTVSDVLSVTATIGVASWLTVERFFLLATRVFRTSRRLTNFSHGQNSLSSSVALPLVQNRGGGWSIVNI